jgi:hypothetical protein
VALIFLVKNEKEVESKWSDEPTQAPDISNSMTLELETDNELVEDLEDESAN